MYDVIVKMHPRIRKTVKWGGLALTVLLVAAWIGSGWWDVVWFWSRTRAGTGAAMAHITLGAGCVHVQHGRFAGGASGTAPMFPGRIVLAGRRSLHIESPFWWWQAAPITFDDASPGAIPMFGGLLGASITSSCTICLWPLMLAATVTTVLAWRIDRQARRRERAGECPECRYDRTGLVSDALCPECGAASPTPPSPRVS